MAVSSAMFLTGVFQWGVRQSTTVESQMVSIERILDYTQLEPEASLRSDPGKHRVTLDGTKFMQVVKFSKQYNISIQERNLQMVGRMRVNCT